MKFTSLAAPVAVLALTASPAMSQTITLACKFVDGLQAPSNFPEAQLNQVVIESAVPSVQLSIAQTVNTRSPIVLRYANTGHERMTMMKTVDGVMVFSGVREPIVYAFVFEPKSGWLIWSQAWDAHNTRVWRYKCEP